MPRDSSETRARLLAEAERLFASSTIHQVTNREITEAAGQKNASALNYHFGSRGDLLLEILRAHGNELDAERGRRGAHLDVGSPTVDIIAALVEPYGAKLGDPSGRNYLTIVDQLREQIGQWRIGPAAGDVHLQRLLEILLGRPRGLPVEVREQRLLSMMLLMVAAMAARAREIESGAQPALDHDAFVANLTDMLVGVIEAPTSGDHAHPVAAGLQAAGPAT